MRFLLSKMTPKPSERDINDFLSFNMSNSNKEVIVPSEVLFRMKDEVLNPKRLKNKKGKLKK